MILTRRDFFHKTAILLLCFKMVFSAAEPVAWAAAPAQESPWIRVMVTEKRTTVTLSVKGAYKISAYPSMKLIQSGPELKPMKLVRIPGGFRLGENDYAVESLLIQPAEDRTLYLDSTRFRGEIRILKDSSGLMFAVNRLPLEKYLYGVLHHEVAPWWPMEALKAQAIAARSYALYQSKVSKAAPYDVKSGTSSQVYGGSTTERYRTKKAVDKTAGVVLTYDGAVFPAYFHATCAGTTAAAKELWKIDLPTLSGGAKCNYCRISPHFYWQAKVPLSVIENKMKQNNRPIGRILKIEPVSQTPSARVGSLRVTGTLQEVVIAAKDFRVWVGGDLMKSTDFKVELREDVAWFRGKGWGHGVGLCQWGTLGQSLLGKSHQDILRFYYPNSVLSKIS